MRYRMEAIKDELVVRNVETDIKLGYRRPFWMDDPHNPDRSDNFRLHRPE